MSTRATTLLALVLLITGVLPAAAQTTVTVREINQIPQDNVTFLESRGADLTRDEIVANIQNDLWGSEVTFQAIVLTDPLSSGLGNISDGSNPSRIHVYVRDVAAESQGVAGMDVQLVDGAYQTSGLINAIPGDCVEVTGVAAPFVGSTGISMQVAPTSITPLGAAADCGVSEATLEPVTVLSSDINKAISDGQGGQQINWSNISSLNGQFVRLENVTVTTRDISTDRPNWLVSSDNGTTVVNFYDMSLRYRNDRDNYPDTWNKRTRDDGDFTPPPPGAVIDLQGYLVFQGDDPFARGVPAGQILSIVPFADSDLVIVESPPAVSNLSKPNFVPTTDAVTVTADVAVDAARTVQSVSLIYTASDNASEQSVAGTDNGDGTWSFVIPAQADGVFVSYLVDAVDNTGASSRETSPSQTIRFLQGGITSIAQIQTTATGGPGDSPFSGVTTDMDITAVMMTDPAISGLAFIQDDETLAGWSGIQLRDDADFAALAAGDVIRITSAEVEEGFGLTRLDEVVFEVVSQGGAAYDYKVVPTSVLQDPAVAEAHEGMSLRFENVTVTATNADAPSGPFGEFNVSSDGTADNAVRVDDSSDAMSYDGGDPATLYFEGQPLASVQGVLSYSFSNYKLWPGTFDDIVAGELPFLVRDINRIPQANVDFLESRGAALTRDEIVANIQNDLWGTEVTFQAIVLTDPLSSGLGNISDGTNPSRIHVYVRDANAAQFGVDGMGVQLVDGAYQTSGLINAIPGDCVEVTGLAAPFVGSTGISMQVAPTSITPLGAASDCGASPEDAQPVVVTTADINKAIDDGQGGQQINWANISSLNGQYVRLENVTVTARDISTDRPNWLVSSDGGETVVNFYDMSLRYRNDRDNYPDTWNKRTRDDGDFTPPPPGAVINLQGYLVFQGDDPFARGVPTSQIMSIVPFADTDLEIVESPPAVSELTKPQFVPTTDPITITADVAVDAARDFGSVDLYYFTTADATVQIVPGTPVPGKTATGYSFELPAQDDGVFVTYWIVATDNTGASSAETSPRQTIRFLAAGIDSIEDIQLTADGGPGDSPFAGVTTNMDLTATLMTNPGETGLAFIQDDEGLAGWSGVQLRDDGDFAALSAGDVIRITNAEIEEGFGLTRLDDVTFEIVSQGGAALDYKVVPTDVLQDPAVAEAHEGMALRFENVTITATNADAPNGPFGEFAVSSDGTSDNAIRVDDSSDALSYDGGDPASVYSEGQTLAFVQGTLSYSFSNYKLWPGTSADIQASGTAVEPIGGEIPGSFALQQNYPNPFNPQTTIRYDLAAASAVQLEVFDLLGRRVALLVNESQPAGQFSVSFNGRDLTSGVYVYRLQAGDRVFTNTMLLLK